MPSSAPGQQRESSRRGLTSLEPFPGPRLVNARYVAGPAATAPHS